MLICTFYNNYLVIALVACSLLIAILKYSKRFATTRIAFFYIFYATHVGHQIVGVISIIREN